MEPRLTGRASDLLLGQLSSFGVREKMLGMECGVFWF